MCENKDTQILLVKMKTGTITLGNSSELTSPGNICLFYNVPVSLLGTNTRAEVLKIFGLRTPEKLFHYMDYTY